MFEDLKKYRYVIVTGPHRSGTTILAHMIANDTNKTFLDEANIYHSYVRYVPQLLREEDDIILQAPYILPWSPVITRQDLLFVLCVRDVNEIRVSIMNSKIKSGKKISMPRFSPEQAYWLWKQIKPLLHNTMEVHYKSLSQHPFWIDKERRQSSSWHHKQIDITGKRLTKVDYSQKNY